MAVACTMCVSPHICNPHLVTALDKFEQTEQAWVHEMLQRCIGSTQGDFTVYTGAVMEIQALVVSIAIIWCCAGCDAAESSTALRSKVVSCLRASLLHVKTDRAGSIVKSDGRVMRTAAIRQCAAPDRTLCTAKDRDC